MITGASSGFGKEAAKMCVELGAKVVLGARREDKLKELCEYHPIEKKDGESEEDDEMEDEGEGNDESGDSDDNAMHQKDAEDVEGSDDDEDKCSGCDKCCLDNFLSPFKDYVMTLGDGGSLIFLD